MPLLNKQPFVPVSPPSDLGPEEEVFVCQATKEVFRDYEEFFNRHFLCNSLVWTCELTGATNLTYKQAQDSEVEAHKVLDSLGTCYRRAALTLVHHTRRTNVRTLADEICTFYRNRFIVDEEVNLQTKPTGAKTAARVVTVTPPKLKSPIKLPVIAEPPPMSPTHPFDTPNGTSQEPKPKTPRTPKTPSTPLCPEQSLNPMDYQYVVELVGDSTMKLQVPAEQLSRTKGVLTPRKLKLFLRNALIRPSEKHPLMVKEEYVQHFDLGPCTIEMLLSPTSGGRKRFLSQSNLETFFTPGSEYKKPRPSSLGALKKDKRSPKGKGSVKTPKRKKSVKTPSELTVARFSKVPQSLVKTAKSPHNKMEALKALNKARKFKQMDLKKSVMWNVQVSEEEMAAMKLRAEEERVRLAAAREVEKQRRKEERMRKLQEKWDRKRREKMRQVEWLKPREDTLCEDSKPIPEPVSIPTSLSSDQFAHTVMILEFLHTFGPLFNIREAIPTAITYSKLEYAILSNDPDSILFEIIKFLLMALFAVMEEEHESQVHVYTGDSIAELEGNQDSVEQEDQEVNEELPTVSEGVAEPLIEEMEEDEQNGLDVRVETLKTSAALFAKWPFLTQRCALSHLVLDSFTCTEVLRLHLLSSGGYKDVPQRRLNRAHRRGNYSDADDAAIDLRLRRPDLLDTLSQKCVYDLSPSDKLELLSTIVSQLLSYSASREQIDDGAHRVKKARKAIREIQRLEEKRLKEKARLKKERKKAQDGDTKDQPANDDETICDEAVVNRENVPCPEEDEEERKSRIEEELKQLRGEQIEASGVVSVQPIGSDRYHRKYWQFLSLPGLYVEPQRGAPQSSIDSVTDTSAPVPNDVSPQRHWACFNSPDDIDKLLVSLNPRGLRELALARALRNVKESLVSTMQKFPIAPWDRRSPTPSPKYKSAEEFLELYLREQTLDIEEKIYIGTLGALKGVEDRLRWRESIENSGAAANLQISDNLPDNLSLAGETAPDNRVSNEAVNRPVVELAQALLQVQAGIEPKFLMPPLGMAVDEKKQKQGRKKNGVVKESDVCLEQWRISLGKSTSFSQIYVHLSTLERAVMWSKSLMNVRCRICRRKTGDEFLLLCDGCDHGYHTYCLRPPLCTIPEGDWFCYNCVPVTPVKPKRPNHKLVVNFEESSDEDEDEEEEEEEEEEEHVEEVEDESVTLRRSLRSKNRDNGHQRVTRGGRRTRRSARLHSSSPESIASDDKVQVRRKLKLDSLQLQTENALSSVVELKCTHSGRQMSSAVRREARGLEHRVCLALLDEVSRQKDSQPFATPVKKKEFPDYYDIISQPMDLQTVRGKIKWNKYNSVEEFLSDMDLIFSNCLTYHKRHSSVGRAGSALHKFFEKRCNDLGIRELLCARND